MEQVRQGILKRLVAAVIDGVAIFVLSVSIGVAFMWSPYLASILSGVAVLAYMATEVLFARTPGKMVLSLTVTAQDGTPASQAALIKRMAVKCAPTIITLVAAITTVGLLNLLAGVVALAVLAGAFLMLRPDRLAGHDIVAGTAVYGSADPKLTFTMPTLPKAAVAQA